MNYTFDHELFLWLNFDGGQVMDTIMEVVSGTLMWLPLYAYIIYAAWRKCGVRGAVTFVVCLALAIGLADMVCGIFKHTGLLKHLWESFPVRHRPMFDPAVRDLAHVPSYAHGPYGTVSAHAATVAALAIMSALMIRRAWYVALIVVAVVLIDYSRIYLACHFPMDIFLGTAVGLATGGAMYLLWKKLDATVKKFVK